MEKVIVVNKPKGKTSYQIVREFKRKYPGEKIGHAGTLDPLAEGVLILLIGKATKRQMEFMKLEKEYLVEAALGFVTTTWDMEGEVVSRSKKKVNKEKVEGALNGFRGEFEQIIPAFSAVKVKGKRLYQLARKGKIEIKDLPRKKVKIHKIKLLDFWQEDYPMIKVRMVVSKGTYVRSVIYQLGEKLGTGATTTRLVRTRVGDFKIPLGTNEGQSPLGGQDILSY